MGDGDWGVFERLGISTGSEQVRQEGCSTSVALNPVHGRVARTLEWKRVCE